MVIVPFVYLLSLGPAVKLQAAGILPEKLTIAMYAPLVPLCRTETFTRAVLWYLAYVWRVPIDL